MGYVSRDGEITEDGNHGGSCQGEIASHGSFREGVDLAF